MNISKLTQLIDGKKITKALVIKRTGMSRTTLDAILDGKDFKVSNLEKIAAALNVNVGYFFEDDGVVIEDYHTEGDFSPATKDGNVSVVVGDTVLSERIKSLEASNTEKDARIEELNERIADLKDHISELKHK